MEPLTILAWVGIAALALVILAVAGALAIVIVRAALAADIKAKNPAQPTGPRAVK